MYAKIIQEHLISHQGVPCFLENINRYNIMQGPEPNGIDNECICDLIKKYNHQPKTKHSLAHLLVN